LKILVLSPFLPYPLSQGGKIRIFNIVKQLSRSHLITLVAIVDNRTDAQTSILQNFCEDIIVVERPARLWPDRLRFLLGRYPYNVIRYESRALKEELNRLRKLRKFDLVQIEFSMMWQYAGIFKGIPVVLDAHNIEHNIIKQIRDAHDGAIKKAMYTLEENRLREKERQAWRECDLCFAVSDREREIISSYPGNPDKVFTIPNGVDLERFHFYPKTRMDNQLLFIGGMDYIPNLDSAHYFLHEIFPLVQSKIPAVKVDVVGRELWRIKNQKSLEAVQFHETVPDVLPFFRKADVLLVPLRYGAGTRIKILEAMAAGVPVVSTSKGCEGIEVVSGEHLMIADSPDSFALSVQRLLVDPGLKMTIMQNARHLVETKYAWEKIVGDMEMCYGKITH